jgi:ribosomal protein S18 acetylase RimI-like enzyme
MTEPEYTVWLAETIPAYASGKVASGQWSKDASLELAIQEYAELLPHGIKTNDNYLFTIIDSQSAPVGILWFAVKMQFNARVAYVFDVSVRPERQREGHAQRAFVALEEMVQRLELSGIALHVFGHNTGAQALYAKLGYQPTNINLFKHVGVANA